MTAPMMRAYTEQLVAVCHRRGAMAIGGMAAAIPSRRDAEANERALAKVREDKTREAGDGFDGSWVAHPDLVPICREVFDGVLGDRPNQLDRQRPDVHVTPAQLLDVAGVPGDRTMAGLRGQRRGGAALPGGLARRQRRGRHPRPDGGRRDRGDQPLAGVAVGARRRRAGHRGDGHRGAGPPGDRRGGGRDRRAGDRLDDARRLFEQVALADEFPDFLTLPGLRADRLRTPCPPLAARGGPCTGASRRRSCDRAGWTPRRRRRSGSAPVSRGSGRSGSRCTPATCPPTPSSPGWRAAWGAAALAALDEHGLPDLGLDPALVEEVLPRVRAKLATEPVEDLRVDAEDGYRGAPDAEDDDVLRAAAVAGRRRRGRHRAAVGRDPRPSRSRGRPGTAASGPSTCSSAALGGGRAVVTLPKVTDVEQVRAFLPVLDALRGRARGRPSTWSCRSRRRRRCSGPDGDRDRSPGWCTSPAPG